MTEAVSLVQLQEAWNQLIKEFPQHDRTEDVGSTAWYLWRKESEWFKKVGEFGVLLQRLMDFEAERNQKIAKLFDISELQRDIRSEEDHQQANPEIDPYASNLAIQMTKGRIYERQFVQKKFEALVCEGKNQPPKTET